MESFERFSQHRSVIEEFASDWLSSYSTDLARLIHISTLRDVYTGLYHHPPLEENYGQCAVHQALSYCHEEIFTKFLENTVEQQRCDLRSCLTRTEPLASEIAQRWLDLELFRSFLPAGAPPYLRDLFLSNIRGLLTLVVEEREQISTAV